jgi:hypothetical protein
MGTGRSCRHDGVVRTIDWCEAFEGWKIERVGADAALFGDMDQAALHGILQRIRWLGVDLVEVRRLPPTPGRGGH